MRLKNSENLTPMKTKDFIALLEGLRIKETEDLFLLLARAFRNSAKKVDVELMLNRYMELYPNTELPTGH